MKTNVAAFMCLLLTHLLLILFPFGDSLAHSIKKCMATLILIYKLLKQTDANFVCCRLRKRFACALNTRMLIVRLLELHLQNLQKFVLHNMCLLLLT